MAHQSIIFINGKIWRPHGSFNEAFGIKDNVIDFLGTNSNALQIKNNYTNIVDLKGKLVLPGLIDGHLHLCYGSLMLKRLNARNVNSFESLKSEINRYLKNHPDNEWIIGSNINLNTLLKDFSFAEGNFVDEIYSERPLFIANYDYHSALCNSLALERSSLISNLDKFSNSEVTTDSNGKPTGIIKENALDFVFENLPKPGIKEKARAAYDFIQLLHYYGITSVSDITLIEDFDVYNKLFEDNKLKIRVNSYIPFEEFINLEEHINRTKNIDSDFYSIKGFKAYYDGSLGSETALFSKNYKGKNHNGYKTDTVTSGVLSKLAHEIDKQDKQMIIHAIGDLAVAEVLYLYESLVRENSKHERRHRIEHAQHIREDDLQRFKQLGVIASVQPLHLKYDIPIVKDKLPDELINTTHNYKKLIDLGVTVNFGTDFPIVEVNPFENIKMAITRKAGDEIFNPQNSIDLHNCIKAYTINNAFSNFNDNVVGTIQKGKRADFVIMEDNLFEMRPEEIGSARVWKTYYNGEEVYSAF
ncbi:MAG TPA: amidohydrolase [Ignavibacteria bacterium]|jgi:hypothetical protein